MAAINDRKMIFGKKCQMTLRIHCMFINLVDIAPSRTVSRFKMTTKKNYFWQKVEKVEEDCMYSLWVKNFIEIIVSHTVSEIIVFCESRWPQK